MTEKIDPVEVMAYVFGLVIASERHNESVEGIRAYIASGHEFLYSGRDLIEIGREHARSALAAAEAAGMVMVERKVIELAADRMDVAASRVDRADTEFGFRVWAQELRASLAQQEKP